MILQTERLILRPGLPEDAEERKKVPTPGFKPLYERILRDGQEAGEVRDDVLLLDAQSLHSAISVRVSDIKIISVGDVPPLFPSVEE